MPETSIHKHSDTFSSKDEIRLDDQRRCAMLGQSATPRCQRQPNDEMASPPLDASFPKGRNQCELRALVPLAPDSGHQVRAILYIKYISHRAPLAHYLGGVPICAAAAPGVLASSHAPAESSLSSYSTIPMPGGSPPIKEVGTSRGKPSPTL